MHPFLLKAGQWRGFGDLSFSGSLELFRFYVKWVVQPKNGSTIHCQQYIETPEGSPQLNQISFHFSSVDRFDIVLQTNDETVMQGHGVISDKVIQWEYKQEGRHGKETYTLQDNGEYLFHAEYQTADIVHSLVDGKMWNTLE